MKQPAIAEDGVYLKGSEIGWFDSDLFNQRRVTHGLKPMSNSTLSKWIIDQFSVVSRPQCEPNPVNLPFKTGETRHFSRPDTFGRVAIIDTDIGAFEVKGIGVRPGQTPSLHRHGTGLIGLTAAVCEICTEAIVRSILRRNLGVETVRFCALILTDIRMKSTESSEDSERCALIVREHFPRFRHDLTSPTVSFQLLDFFQSCEDALRLYGLTSAFPDTNLRGRYVNGEKALLWRGISVPNAVRKAVVQACKELSIDWDTEWDLINLQACLDTESRTLKIVDFGSFEYRDQFMVPSINAVMGRMAMTAETMEWSRGRFTSCSDHVYYQGLINTPQSEPTPFHPLLDAHRSVPVPNKAHNPNKKYDTVTKYLAIDLLSDLNGIPPRRWPDYLAKKIDVFRRFNANDLHNNINIDL